MSRRLASVHSTAVKNFGKLPLKARSLPFRGGPLMAARNCGLSIFRPLSNPSAACHSPAAGACGPLLLGIPSHRTSSLKTILKILKRWALSSIPTFAAARFMFPNALSRPIAKHRDGNCSNKSKRYEVHNRHPFSCVLPFPRRRCHGHHLPALSGESLYALFGFLQR